MLIWKNKKIVPPPLAFLALVLLVVSSICVPIEGHMPGAKAPLEFELTPIDDK
jgi:hypothetical protein